MRLIDDAVNIYKISMLIRKKAKKGWVNSFIMGYKAAMAGLVSDELYRAKGLEKFYTIEFYILRGLIDKALQRFNEKDAVVAMDLVFNYDRGLNPVFSKRNDKYPIEYMFITLVSAYRMTLQPDELLCAVNDIYKSCLFNKSRYTDIVELAML